MRTSTRIVVAYRTTACVILILACALAYAIWSYQPFPNTLGEMLRPIGIAIILAVGTCQAYLAAIDPFAKRVVRVLRNKSL